MQMNPYQRVQLFGAKGSIEIEIPFNAPPDRETRVFIRTGSADRTETFPICDQYTLQGDAFARQPFSMTAKSRCRSKTPSGQSESNGSAVSRREMTHRPRQVTGRNSSHADQALRVVYASVPQIREIVIGGVIVSTMQLTPMIENRAEFA